MKIKGCNCWQWPGSAGGKRAFLFTSMFDGWLCSYRPSYLHYQHAPCESYNLPRLPALKWKTVMKVGMAPLCLRLLWCVIFIFVNVRIHYNFSYFISRQHMSPFAHETSPCCIFNKTSAQLTRQTAKSRLLMTHYWLLMGLYWKYSVELKECICRNCFKHLKLPNIIRYIFNVWSKITDDLNACIIFFTPHWYVVRLVMGW